MMNHPPARRRLDDREVADALVAGDPHLPALALVLDHEALSERVGAPTQVRRLRYKPGTAVHAAITIEPDARWHLLAGYGPDSAAKAVKDRRTAHDRGQRTVADGVRWLIVEARADRHLPEAPLRILAPGPGVLAYNPRRRLVVGGPDGAEPRLVTKVHAAGSVPVDPRLVAALRAAGVATPAARCTGHPQVGRTCWQPGRHVRPGNDGGAVADTLSALAAAPAESVPRWAASSLRERVDRALALVPTLRPRATEVTAMVATALARRLPELDRLPPVLLHGDLSPDQVVIDNDRAWLLDLDDCAAGPQGWDQASWLAAQVAEGSAVPVALPGPAPDPILLAAALALRAPEPFSRQRSGWAGRIDEMLAQAAQVLELPGPGDGGLDRPSSLETER